MFEDVSSKFEDTCSKLYVQYLSSQHFHKLIENNKSNFEDMSSRTHPQIQGFILKHDASLKFKDAWATSTSRTRPRNLGHLLEILERVLEFGGRVLVISRTCAHNFEDVCSKL
jgi:hypothetical protein